MKAFFHTLGCKVNQYETQAMMSLMKEAGFDAALFHTDMPDVGNAVIVVNSCTVTSEGDRKLRQLLRRIRRTHPTALTVLCGCMPQAFPEEASALQEADIVLGNTDRRLLPEAVAAFIENGERIVRIRPHDREIESLHIDDFDEHTRAFVKIEDGCDRFCSYCIIPFARGRVRSRRPEDIAAELAVLAKAGYREAVLVGINLTSYGKDLGIDLADAVKAACAVDGIERVRLGSLEPDHMTDDLIDRLATEPKLCEQFHLALQSGCDATLRRMNRHYTTAEFQAVCRKLRDVFPHCSLTTDIIVGFPGETDADFEASAAFAADIGFASVHVFPYSKRDGTRAAVMDGQVARSVKAARAAAMTKACAAARAAVLQRQLGTTQDVLCERPSPDGTHTLGYTRTYLPCEIDGRFPSGSTVKAEIYDIRNDTLSARVNVPSSTV